MPEFVTAWALIALATAILWIFWRMLNFSFDLIDQWQAAARESCEDQSANMERES